jgi:hypothetical protein
MEYVKSITVAEILCAFVNWTIEMTVATIEKCLISSYSSVSYKILSYSLL